MIQNETTCKTFEVKDRKYVYEITGIEFNPEEERLFGKIKLKGTKKQANFYINFEPHLLDKFYVEDYKGSDDEDIYGVIDKFDSEHIEEKITCDNMHGDFELTKKIIFK
jgi:hypothetical protein